MYPTTIIDQPIPLLDGSLSQPSGSNTDSVSSGTNVVTPIRNVDQRFPIHAVAVETISSSINTETKAILGEYTFGELGALVIGKFFQGVSGELKLSPNGVLARNINGQITFALDGTTGNATFVGTLQTGTVISGLVIVGDNRIVIDGANERIVISDGTNDRILIGRQDGGF